MSKKEEPRPVYKLNGLTDEEALEMIRLVNESPGCLVSNTDNRYKGRVKLRGSIGSGVDDFMTILLTNGYRVTAEIVRGNNGAPYTIISFEKPLTDVLIEDDYE